MLILGSSSPRRKEILSRTILKFRVEESYFKEVFPEKGSIYDKIQKVALDKAHDIYSKENVKEDDIVVSADTIIYFKKEILGKPRTHEDAFEMLKRLNNKKHVVITGVAIVTKDVEITFYEKSKVYFRKNDVKDLEDYSQTREVLDKAGSYAIQGFAVQFIKKWKGDYNNIMGLPLARLCKELKPLLKIDEEV